ncbi:MAG: hypothetical protein CMP39_04485 [Rickettsiales bacterium]|nr:hypothetical protein [Rickettsiales bacterium]
MKVILNNLNKNILLISLLTLINIYYHMNILLNESIKIHKNESLIKQNSKTIELYLKDKLSTKKLKNQFNDNFKKISYTKINSNELKIIIKSENLSNDLMKINSLTNQIYQIVNSIIINKQFQTITLILKGLK